MQLFWHQGYAATSIEDVSSTLHLSRSSLYATFGDKRALFLEALQFYSDQVLRRTAQTLNEAPSPIVGLHALFESITDAGQEAGARGCFMVNSIAELAPYDPEVAVIASAYSDAFQLLLTQTIEQIDVASSPSVSQEIAAYLFNALQGMRLLAKLGTSREQLQAVSRLTLQCLG